MKFTQEGDWMVSTPLYFGSAAQVRQAADCGHRNWSADVREIQEGHLLVTERCSACVATRVKCRKAMEADLQEKKS